MASVALPAEAAVMHILLGVATDTHAQGLAARHIGFLVAVVTQCLFMAAGQRVLGCRVIEIPRLPGSRVVTAFAFDAEAPLVLVILLVALVTDHGRIAESRRQVTFLAFDLGMAAG